MIFDLPLDIHSAFFIVETHYVKESFAFIVTDKPVQDKAVDIRNHWEYVMAVCINCHRHLESAENIIKEPGGV